MNAGDIAFPNLGIYLKDVPKSFSVFGFDIAFYGLIIGIGVLAGLLMAVHMAKVTGQNPEVYWDFSIYAVIFSIIGARIYYVIFAWDFYKDNLLGIFQFRNGGLAIYGGVIAAFITLFIYCRIKKQNPLLIGDTAMPGLILGQAIGRWGNFMNREVFGEYYDGLFSMQLPVSAVRARDISENIAAHIPEGANYINVHPTFLYESVWNLLVFAALLLFRRYKRFHGELCLLYLGGYGLGRFIIEGIRTDTLFIPGTTLPVSQVLALLMVVFAVGADIVVRVRSRASRSKG
ncbi:MAG: prolipoprotein diacylglyceryl transferase [Lachnospiraceae bacterium]|jgi:phosphatidylglycerol:prolipoprotein diacylglycerol transferase|nr:prolipoprotein diacylglyceryl transferase [Lachnospiraceae bacterium]